MRFAAVGVLALTACGFGAGPPSFAVPLENNEWGAYELFVYDQSGLVTGVRSLEKAPGMADVVAHPERNEIEFAWTGGACSHRPTLHVTGSPLDLTLIVSNPSDPQFLPFLPIACPAVGIPLAATISLAVPVDQSSVEQEVNY